jgi:hypothetical protein
VIQCGQNFGSGVGTSVYTVLIGVFGVIGGMPIALAVAAVFGGLTFVSALFLGNSKDDGRIARYGLPREGLV